jgi:tetrahydromethanopterin S-methyltransferase subunit F
MMRNDEIRKEWEATINDVRYKPHLVSDDELVWMQNLESVNAYIDENQIAPSPKDGNLATKLLGRWTVYQQTIYTSADEIMANESIRSAWEATISDVRYKPHLVTKNALEWMKTLAAVKDYIDEHNTVPSPNDENEKTRKLGRWIGTQNRNFKTATYTLWRTKKSHFQPSV